MKRSLRSIAVLAALAAPALAGDPGLGDGHWGPLNLRYATVSLNRATALQAPASGTVLPVASSAGFAAGDLAMVYQAQGAFSVDSGPRGAFALRAPAAGKFELAPIAAVDGG